MIDFKNKTHYIKSFTITHEGKKRAIIEIGEIVGPTERRVYSFSGETIEEAVLNLVSNFITNDFEKTKMRNLLSVLKLSIDNIICNQTIL